MISRSDMIALICRFREMCLEQYPADIDPLTAEKRLSRMGLEAQDTLLDKLHVGSRPGPIEDVCRLVKNPRLLKSIFRNSYQTWQCLHGELDFDDICVSNVLRFAAPEAFGFLLEHSNEIRALELKGQFSKHDERLKDIERKWSEFTKNVAWDTASGKSLIQFLFPCWRESDHPWGGMSPQGVQEASPTDYWARFLAGEVGDKEFRDQDILRGLKCYKEAPNGKLFRGMSIFEALSIGKVFTDRFEHFAHIVLDGKDVRRIGSSFFELSLRMQGNMADKDSPHGFLPLWRVALRTSIDENDHIKWVQAEILKALPLNLEFANSIYYYWRSNNESDIRMGKPYFDLRAGIVAGAKEVYSKSPEVFIATINPKHIYSSYHFSVFFSSEKGHGSGFVPADWDWFAKLLLRAVSINPQTILPQVVCFVIKEERTYSDFSYSFDQSFCAGLFGNYKRELMIALSQEIALEGFTPREVAMIKFAKDYATEWLRLIQKIIRVLGACPT